MTHFSPLTFMRYLLILTVSVLLSACATVSNNPSSGNVSFGASPDNYKQLVKSYLQAKPTRTPLDLERIEFLNEPNKFIFNQMKFGPEKFGYRVCALISTQSARQLRSHFFLINDGKVIEHLHDSGLVPLSDQFCNVQMLALETRAARTPVEQQVDEHGFRYIVCHGDGKESFFALNPEQHQLVQQHDGRTVANYDIEQLSDSYIVANGDNDARISINRVSGTLLYQHNGMEAQSSCELTSKQKF